MLEIGIKFNRLTLIKYLEKTGKGKYKRNSCLWLCDCGNEKVISENNVKSNNVKSCGCLRIEVCKKGILPNNLRAKHCLVNSYKQNAKKRNLDFTLSEEKVLEITSMNCSYCGAPPSNNNKAHGILIYNGIDRVDNTKGYILNNVISCCFTCNSAKRVMSKIEFLQWIEKVYNHSIYKNENKEQV